MLRLAAAHRLSWDASYLAGVALLDHIVIRVGLEQLSCRARPLPWSRATTVPLVAISRIEAARQTRSSLRLPLRALLTRRFPWTVVVVTNAAERHDLGLGLWSSEEANALAGLLSAWVMERRSVGGYRRRV